MSPSAPERSPTSSAGRAPLSGIPATLKARHSPPATFPHNWKTEAECLEDLGIIDAALGDFFAGTKQDQIPQAAILSAFLDTLGKSPDAPVMEAYLRGSFSQGSADYLSDIDLFLVVKPDKLEKLYDQFVDFLGRQGEIIVGCHDKLVKDYGGIGFMFLADVKGIGMLQFDLYCAIDGIPPKAYVTSAPRVLRTPGYCWFMQTDDTLRDHPARPFIDKVTHPADVAEKISHLLDEALVTLSIQHKHLKRGHQYSRALADDHALLTTVTEILIAASGHHTPYSPLYALSETLEYCRTQAASAPLDLKSKALAELAASFDKVIHLPVGAEKLHAYADMTRDITAFCGTYIFDEKLAKRTQKSCAILYKKVTPDAPPSAPGRPAKSKAPDGSQPVLPS